VRTPSAIKHRALVPPSERTKGLLLDYLSGCRTPDDSPPHQLYELFNNGANLNRVRIQSRRFHQFGQFTRILMQLPMLANKFKPLLF
jgi:hypothetical protein